MVVRIYYLDNVDHIRHGEWLDCDLADIHREATQRLGDYFAIEVWNRSEKLLRIEKNGLGPVGRQVVGAQASFA